MIAETLRSTIPVLRIHLRERSCLRLSPGIVGKIMIDLRYLPINRINLIFEKGSHRYGASAKIRGLFGRMDGSVESGADADEPSLFWPNISRDERCRCKQDE